MLPLHPAYIYSLGCIWRLFRHRSAWLVIRSESAIRLDTHFANMVLFRDSLVQEALAHVVSRNHATDCVDVLPQ